MPIHSCQINGKSGKQWGQSGKCYTGSQADQKAQAQAQAIYAAGYEGNTEKDTPEDIQLVKLLQDTQKIIQKLSVVLQQHIEEATGSEEGTDLDQYVEEWEKYVVECLQEADIILFAEGKDINKEPDTLLHTAFPDLFDFDSFSELYQPPQTVQQSAEKVLQWREEYGDQVSGMTALGWARARQFASGRSVSLDTVTRMAQFSEHKLSYRKARRKQKQQQHPPWTYGEIVRWLGWGGSSGIEWAKHVSGVTDESK